MIDLAERTYLFSKSVVLYIRQIDVGKFDYPIISQVLRSATSIGANVIEARSGNSRRNLIYFFSIALRSANETKYWLSLIRDTLNVDNKESEMLIQESIELAKILAKSILTSKKNDIVTSRAV